VGVAVSVPHVGPVDEVCASLLKQLRARCPGLIPADPLPPGTTGAVVPVTPAALGPLVITAAQQATAESAPGGGPVVTSRLPDSALWRDGIDSLLVHLGTIGVSLGNGTVTVAVPVACDQMVDAKGAPQSLPVTVMFVIGTRDRPTGMFAATPHRPDGPAVVVERWGESLTALAWRALLDAAAGVAAAAGQDSDGAALIPTAMVATPDGLLVQTQARHPFDRDVVGRAVP